jgi:ribonuclease J
MSQTVRIVPMGGLGEVGKNMLAVEYGRNILVIDAGIMFPESDMLGVDYVIPDWDYLRDKKEMVRAIVITHGHEDHIGALHHFLSEFDVPVYATRLTRGLIEVRLKQKGMLDQARLNTFSPGDSLSIGPFTVEPYHVCHSIPDGVGLGITTPAGLIVHSGDFKIDHTPVDGWPTDYAKLAEFSGRGVLALLSDSTNADQPGMTASEAVLNQAFDQVMREASGRVIVATFASLISRIQQVMDVADQNGRKVAIAGRTMVENARMAKRLGYLQVPDGLLLNLGEINRLPPQETLILATGSQGEPTAVLGRLAVGQHSALSIEEGDAVVLSSHTIPGNEEMIHRVINRLFQRGADVYYDPLASVHVSGHASQEEQKLLINILGPRFFIPIHGELRHLKQHGKLARQVGVAPENVAVVENGYPLELGEDLRIGDRVPGGYVFVDGALVGEVGPRVMREREELGRGGFVMVMVPYDRAKGKPAGEARIVSRGFVFVPGAEELLADLRKSAVAAARADPGTPPEKVEQQLQGALSKHIYEETKRRPVIVPVVIEA